MEAGTYITDFESLDSEGHLFDSKKFRAKRILVVYFYPKDFTPGCTKEACDFNAHLLNFEDYNAVVVGISADTAAVHQRFKTRYALKFPLLSDVDASLQKQFDVKKQLLGIVPGRETFVFDTTGKLRFKWRQFSAKLHAQKTLEAVKQIYHEQ